MTEKECKCGHDAFDHLNGGEGFGVTDCMAYVWDSKAGRVLCDCGKYEEA